MEIRTKKQNYSKNQERVSEIAEILVRGICRLESKKIPENKQIQLDNKPFRSLHSIGFNTNKNLVL
jgi:hypothetical protein